MTWRPVTPNRARVLHVPVYSYRVDKVKCRSIGLERIYA